MFDKSTRTLMAMMFERSTVNDISGKMEDGRGWSITCYRPNLFRDDTHYEGYIQGVYHEDFSGDTVDEALDKMQAWLAEEMEAKERSRELIGQIKKKLEALV